MRYGNFFVKAVSLVGITGLLLFYQNQAVTKAALEEENAQAVREAEAYNLEIERQNEEAEKPYVDGTYVGTGTGFGGEITVQITVTDGYIEKIEALSHDGEDDAYFSQAETLLQDILDEQSADVDTVSGATFSSKGLIAAADEALKEAAR